MFYFNSKMFSVYIIPFSSVPKTRKGKEESIFEDEVSEQTQD